ncbi:MAG: nickel/cobalt transporter (NicO) family protein [Actinomycetota bacterium]|jgi:ABC-type nickel/cobalt efflux system permease component RcnA|nr:nickel/cobalt transporter (NicO) family protein [Actinomycetota bacterium]
MRRALVLLAAVVAVLAMPTVALAHPLGNYTINTAAGLHLQPGQVRVEYVVDMAEIPVAQLTPTIDANHDGVMSQTEGTNWARTFAPTLLPNLSLSLNGRPVVLHSGAVSMVFRPGQAGLQTIRVVAQFQGVSGAAAGSFRFADGNYADRATGWREVTAVGESGFALHDATVPVVSPSNHLLAYPKDLLSSPEHVTTATGTLAPGAGMAPAPLLTASASTGQISSVRPLTDGGPFAGLILRHGLGLVLLAFVLAVAFGAWHAMLPGHGKTLMAAYMVSSDAKVRQAVAVGGAVAVMHTASVVGLGLLVLGLERTFRPEELYPWLGLVSGLTALALGVYLLISRLSTWASVRRTEAGAHQHQHEVEHGQGEHHGLDHDHGGVPHSHVIPAGVSLTSRKGLFALALAGGIVPAPSALLVLLSAVSAHRTLYGLALILAFSLGLAAALILMGLGAITAREVVARKLTSTVGRLVPVLSAAAIVGVGLFFTFRSIGQLPI